jgi:hypothetical protein
MVAYCQWKVIHCLLSAAELRICKAAATELPVWPEVGQDCTDDVG